MSGAKRFCATCGTPRSATARFCGGCGQALPVSPPAPPADATAPESAAATRRRSGRIPSATAPLAAAHRGAAWQVIVGTELPPLPVPAIPAVERTPAPEASSLSGPGWYLLFLGALDAVAAHATGNQGAMSAVYLRIGLAAAAAVLGSLSRTNRGVPAKLFSVVSAALALTEGTSIYSILRSSATNASTLQASLPNLVPQVLTGLEALRSAWKARGSSR